MEQRASLENPSTSLSNPAPWLVDWAGGGATKSGVTVGNASAMGISAVYAAIRRISADVAKLPIHTYEKMDRGRRRATEHHMYDVFHIRPNPVMSSYTFWEVLVGHLLSWGNGYAEKELDGAGRVVALWPLRPDRMDVVWTGSRKVYLYRANEGGPIPFTADEVFHVPGFGYDGLVGYNPIRIARESLALNVAAERYGSAFFGNGSRASGVLKTPERLSDEAYTRLRRSWEEQHQGTDNAHRIAILEEGVDWAQIGIPPEEAQFLETRKFQTREVARWFQIAPHKIGDLDNATFGNIEHQSQEHLNDTIQPWVERIERPANWELFPPSERGRFYMRFMIQALLRPDSAARGEFYTKLFQVGALSPNDILEMEDRNPVPGGDQRFVPLNMVPLDGREEPDPPRGGFRSAPDTQEIAVDRGASQERTVALRGRQIGAHYEPFRYAAQGVLNRELIQARRALSRSFGARDQAAFRVWVDEFYATHGEQVAEQMLPAFVALAKSIHATTADEMGAEVDEATVDAFVQEYADVAGVRWAARSRAQLLELLRETAPEDVEAALAARLDEWEEKRADKVALQESHQLANAVIKASYLLFGVTTIRWHNTGSSDCPYCAQMHGRTIAIRGVFLGEGDSVEANEEGKDPLTVTGTIGHPPLHRGCDCQTVAVT
jgi:HK97 family phage portal protein